VTRLYADVDTEQVDDLERVRQLHRVRRDSATGLAWEYVDVGDGPTILFLHGMAGGYDIWFQQVLALSSRRRVLAVTYPPIGSLEELTRQLIELLDSLEVETTSLVGSSLGGYIAQYLVAQYPDRVERAVFANTFPPNDQFVREHSGRLRLAKVVPARVVMKQLRKNVDDAIVPAAGGSALVRAYLLEQAAGRMSKSQFVARFACVLDSFEPPASGDIPVMLVETANDPLVPEELRRMLIETYPEATSVSLDDTGHFPYLNTPESYNALLEEFLD
jgi:maspardin